jgi:hypothetical protein
MKTNSIELENEQYRIISKKPIYDQKIPKPTWCKAKYVEVVEDDKTT